MEKLFQIASNVSTPLALGGIVIAALYYLYRQIVAGKLLTQLTQAFSGKIVEGIVNKVFILALVAMILGFVGWVIIALRPPQPPPPKDSYSVSLTSDMTFRQAAQMIAENDGASVKFSECNDTEVGIKMNPGEMKADSPKSLLETLRYRTNGAAAPNYRVTYLKANSLYEIQCTHN